MPHALCLLLIPECIHRIPPCSTPALPTYS
jgi:hypothetical protein